MKHTTIFVDKLEYSNSYTYYKIDGFWIKKRPYYMVEDIVVFEIKEIKDQRVIANLEFALEKKKQEDFENDKYA